MKHKKTTIDALRKKLGAYVDIVLHERTIIVITKSSLHTPVAKIVALTEEEKKLYKSEKRRKPDAEIS